MDDSVGELKAEIVKHVTEYVKTYGRPMKLQYVAAMYGKRLKAQTGLNPRQFMETSGLFYLAMSETGGMLLTPKD